MRWKPTRDGDASLANSSIFTMIFANLSQSSSPIDLDSGARCAFRNFDLLFKEARACRVDRSAGLDLNASLVPS